MAHISFTYRDGTLRRTDAAAEMREAVGSAGPCGPETRTITGDVVDLGEGRAQSKLGCPFPTV
jgi:hypothetical protein